MSKLLRLPFAVLAVLALFLLMPGVAAATPTAASTTEQPAPDDCDPATAACPTSSLADVLEETLKPVEPTTTVEPETTDGAQGGGGSTGPQGTEGSGADPTVTTPQSRVAAAAPVQAATLAEPLSAAAVVPPDFTVDDLEEALAGIGLDGLSDRQLTDLLEALQGDPPASPLDQFCEIFDVPNLCGAPPTCPSVPDPENPCVPPLSCDAFAQIFGFDDCDSIPLCIPSDSVPPGSPFPLPSPPFCEAPTQPAGGTPTTNTPSTPTQAQTQPQPQPQPQGVYYANCDDARAKGAAPVYAGQPGYRPELDSDHDNIGCETDTQLAAASTQPNGKLAYTGVDVEGLIRLGAILLSGGTLILLAGMRRA